MTTKRKYLNSLIDDISKDFLNLLHIAITNDIKDDFLFAMIKLIEFYSMYDVTISDGSIQFELKEDEE